MTETATAQGGTVLLRASLRSFENGGMLGIDDVAGREGRLEVEEVRGGVEVLLTVRA